MTAALDDVRTANSGIAARAPSAVEGGAREPVDSAGRFVPSDAVQSAGLLLVEERFSIVPEWVLDADVSDAAVRLYAVLLRYGQSSGQRMPSRRTLAERLRKKSVDTVDRALKELVAVGAVEVTRRFRDGVSLTNRYLVRTTRPGTTSRPRPGKGGRTDAATPGGGDRSTATPACADGPADDGGGRGGSRRTAATPGRTDAAGVAARMRPNPEFLTETNPPPHPSSGDARGARGDTGLDTPAGTCEPGTVVGAGRAGTGGRARTDQAGAGRPARVPGLRDSEGVDRHPRVLAALGLTASGLADLTRRCAQVRRELGLPAALWTAGRIADVLAVAVLDRGLSPDAAVPGLLAIAADPATRSPARLGCPGPWWESPPASQAGHVKGEELERLEAVLAEVGGLRVVVQRQARAQLAAEGLPVTRQSVARRAVDLLDHQPGRLHASRS